MEPYEKEVKEIIEALYARFDEAISDCESRLFEASIGKTYENLSSALRINEPFRNSGYKNSCYSELRKRVEERQKRTIIKIRKEVKK